ncbi:MAG: bacterial type and secretion system family protein [Herbaspirillum sp.]|nr:bacterial type and secretion system family protein [Herbaspirillum sp.]
MVAAMFLAAIDAYRHRLRILHAQVEHVAAADFQYLHIQCDFRLPGAHVTTFISGTESRVSGDSLVLRSTEGARVTTGGTRPAAQVEQEPAPEPMPLPPPELTPPADANPGAPVPLPVPEEKPKFLNPGIGSLSSNPPAAETASVAHLGGAVTSAAKPGNPDASGVTQVALAKQVSTHAAPTAPAVSQTPARVGYDAKMVDQVVSMTMMLGAVGMVLPWSRSAPSAANQLKLEHAMREVRAQLALHTQASGDTPLADHAPTSSIPASGEGLARELM